MDTNAEFNSNDVAGIMPELSGLSAEIRERKEVTDMKYGQGLYTGTVINGKPEGRGIMKYTSGGQYEGNWKNGLYDGQGKYTSKEGEDGKKWEYEGEWKGGKKNGHGKQNYSNGDVYEGQWTDGKATGKGKFIEHADDLGRHVECEGTFKDGKLNGEGSRIEYRDDGSKLSELKGTFKDGKLNGEGSRIEYRDDGSKYFELKGTFKDNELNGEGSFVKYLRGSKYYEKKGTFKDDKLNGEGSMVRYNRNNPDGSVQLEKKGEWLMGWYKETDGKFIEYYDDGGMRYTYEGNFDENHDCENGKKVAGNCVMEGNFHGGWLKEGIQNRCDENGNVYQQRKGKFHKDCLIKGTENLARETIKTKNGERTNEYEGEWARENSDPFEGQLIKVTSFGVYTQIQYDGYKPYLVAGSTRLELGDIKPELGVAVKMINKLIDIVKNAKRRDGNGKDLELDYFEVDGKKIQADYKGGWKTGWKDIDLMEDVEDTLGISPQALANYLNARAEEEGWKN